MSGSEREHMLKSHPAGVEGQSVGVEAREASVAARGGKKVRMSPTAQFMIHNAKTRTQGDKWEHRHTADFLQAVDKSIANAYRLKTGLSQNELSTLMNRETWMTAQEALAKGFIDEIMFDDSNQLSAVAHAGIEMIPQQVIDRVRNEIMKFQTEGASFMQVTNQTQVIDPQPPTASNAAPQPPVPNQAQNTQDATAQERERLRAIDAIAANIDPALVNEAKYGENPMTAADLALKAMQEGKMINNGLFNAAVAANQASGALDVTAQSQQQN
ncbi:Clp protease ClpP, partial [Brevibacillus brevis]|uniref:Clp protease ClpP n=1 Tax=Brevibacillus brevis TaxID=1393 RepID=UPI001FD23269